MPITPKEGSFCMPIHSRGVDVGDDGKRTTVANAAIRQSRCLVSIAESAPLFRSFADAKIANVSDWARS
jgi:hypothetical protein